MAGRYRLARLSFDEFVEQMDQGRERWEIHDHGDVAADIAFANGEIDEEEHLDISGLRRWGETEESCSVAAQHFRQRHRQTSMEHVGDGRKAAVEEDVAG